MERFLHPSLARNIVLIAITLFAAMLISRILQSFIRVPKRFRNKRSQTYASVIRNIITAIVYLVAIYVIFTFLGINITPLLASAGVVGIILGFGARPLIEDLIAGFFLLSQNSIAIGDYVKVADAEGYIENIGFRTLTIRELTGALNIIPNGQIKSVVNYSRHRAQVPVTITVSTKKHIDTLLKEFDGLIKQMQKDKKLGYLVYPESRVSGIDELSAEKMVIRVVLVTPPLFRNQVARDFRYKVKKLTESKKIQLG